MQTSCREPCDASFAITHASPFPPCLWPRERVRVHLHESGYVSRPWVHEYVLSSDEERRRSYRIREMG